MSLSANSSSSSLVVALVSLLFSLAGCEPSMGPEAGGPAGVCGGIGNDCSNPECAAAPACQQQTPSQLTPSWDACSTAKGDRGNTPIDIIWVVDSSYSMSDEMGWIQNNMNDFVSFMRGASLDVRVVLLGGQKICVPQPLGGPNCTDGPRFKHLNTYVGSHDGLKKVIELYPQYGEFLRDDSHRVFIATSDDDSDVDAAWFTQQLSGLPGSGFDAFTFHSIVAYGTHPRGCITGAAKGLVYLDLTEQTQGIKFPVCENDWKKILDGLATNVVGMVTLPCTYSPPALPEGKNLNPTQIQVNTASGSGQWAPLSRLPDLASCGQQDGWTFDEQTGQVRLCPQSCGGQQVGQVEVLFGCVGDID